MSLMDLYKNQWMVMQPKPAQPEPGTPGEPDTDEEKEERAEVDTRMLYKRLEKIFLSKPCYLSLGCCR